MKLQPHDWMDVNKEKSSRVWCRAGLSVPSEAGSFSVHFSVYRSLTLLKDTGGRIPKSGKAKHRNGMWGLGNWRSGDGEGQGKRDDVYICIVAPLKVHQTRVPVCHVTMNIRMTINGLFWYGQKISLNASQAMQEATFYLWLVGECHTQRQWYLWKSVSST